MPGRRSKRKRSAWTKHSQRRKQDGEKKNTHGKIVRKYCLWRRTVLHHSYFLFVLHKQRRSEGSRTVREGTKMKKKVDEAVVAR